MLDKQIVKSLQIIWNYMVLDIPIEKSDLIIGCGCKNLSIPIKCSELLKQNYADKILFTGGYGKMTSGVFKKSEAETYKEIAIENGINEDQIYMENKSTNTGDNFRFSLKIIEENNIKANKIIIVHNNLSQRRTLSVAKLVIKDKHISITSPKLSFNEFITRLQQNLDLNTNNIISIIVGDVQRIIIYPQLGWQVENDVPEEVINAYYTLKEKGYSKYIYSKDEIQKLIDKHGLAKGKQANYFN